MKYDTVNCPANILRDAENLNHIIIGSWKMSFLKIKLYIQYKHY